MRYLVIGKYNTAFCEGVSELQTALHYRKAPECRVVASDDWEKLLEVARIGQQRQVDCCIDNSIEQMTLPPVLTGPLSLVYPAHTSLPAVSANGSELGAWGISALNGFCVARSIWELCQILAGEGMVYPIAQWCPSLEVAVAGARSHYSGRFYSRYAVSAESTGMPQMYIEYFVDPFFNEREKRREVQIKQLQKRALDNWERGWLQ